MQWAHLRNHPWINSIWDFHLSKNPYLFAMGLSYMLFVRQARLTHPCVDAPAKHWFSLWVFVRSILGVRIEWFTRMKILALAPLSRRPYPTMVRVESLTYTSVQSHISSQVFLRLNKISRDQGSTGYQICDLWLANHVLDHVTDPSWCHEPFSSTHNLRYLISLESLDRANAKHEYLIIFPLLKRLSKQICTNRSNVKWYCKLGMKYLKAHMKWAKIFWSID